MGTTSQDCHTRNDFLSLAWVIRLHLAPALGTCWVAWSHVVMWLEATFAPGRQEGQAMSLQPRCQSVRLAWAYFFVGPLLGILDMGDQVRCLLRRESGCPCGLRAVPCRPQVGGVRRLLVGLRSRPGHTERDVCAGGRGPGGTSDSWALLHRRATCPRALYGDGMSSRLGPRE